MNKKAANKQRKSVTIAKYKVCTRIRKGTEKADQHGFFWQFLQQRIRITKDLKLTANNVPTSVNILISSYVCITAVSISKYLKFLVGE